MKDFPAVAWFTTRRDVPKCLQNTAMRFVDRKTGEVMKNRWDFGPRETNCVALDRIALGFSVANIPVVPWPDYRDTEEGRELNETAREFGDDPDNWFISEVPVDVLAASEVLISKTRSKPRLEPANWYLKDIRRMVSQCCETKAYIPPSYQSKTPKNSPKILAHPWIRLQ